MRISLFILCSLFLMFSCSHSENSTKLTEANELAQEWKAKHDQLRNSYEAPTLMHTVYFWKKEGLSVADERALVEGCRSLAEIKSVSRLRMGKPAITEDREVVDQSYSYALNVEFVDIAAQDAYQIDPIHLKFVEDHQDKWEKVVVYDNMIE